MTIAAVLPVCLSHTIDEWPMNGGEEGEISYVSRAGKEKKRGAEAAQGGWFPTFLFV